MVIHGTGAGSKYRKMRATAKIGHRQRNSLILLQIERDPGRVLDGLLAV